MKPATKRELDMPGRAHGARIAAVLLATLGALTGVPGWAQTAHAGHGSGGAPTPSATSAPTDTAATAAMPAMGHSSMPPMQGGSPPADARDPNGYAGGFERGVGKYALPNQPPLQLGDQLSFGSLLVNRLEHAWKGGDNVTLYDLQGRLGRDIDALGVKAEGEVQAGKLHDARTELYWSHAIAAYWDTQLGIRHDDGIGPNRTWLAFGVQGLAPYWFEVGATGYVRNGGNAALRLEAEYYWLLTPKLALQPRTEWSFYSKDDPGRDIGKGLSSANAGLRLHYEITRQFKPYVGIEWQRSFDQTANFVRAAGGSPSQTLWVAGLSFWF